jgi:transporter family-2 protein
MTQALYILLAIGVGLGAAFQTGMIASLGRSKGPTEATWISLLATFGAIALAFAVRSLRSDPPDLPSPFDNAAVFAIAGSIAAAALFISLQGLSPILGLTGLFGFAYLISAAFLVPRVGIALFASAVTAGTLLGSVALDHFGAFGATEQRVSLMRAFGLMALILGVVLVRSGR